VEHTQDGSTVDIVSHSMGGLLTRAYLTDPKYAGDYRTHSVVYLGTPHLGTVRAYSAILGNAMILNRLGSELKLSSDRLNLAVQTLMVRNFPGVYELMPQFDFVCEQAPCNPSAPTFEPFRTSFDLLPQASQPYIASTLDFFAGLQRPIPSVRSYAINGSGFHTLSGLDLSDPKCPKVWSDRKGDTKVPQTSASGLGHVVYFYVAGVEHGELPGNPAVQQQILNFLRDDVTTPVDGILPSPAEAPKGGWRSSTCSPIRLRITNAAGDVNGLDADGNLREEIPGASHLVFSENEGGFLNGDETYTVSFKATGNGLFTLQLDRLLPNGGIESAIAYTDIPISANSRGQLTLAPDSTAAILNLDINGDGTPDFAIPSNEPPDPLVFVAVLADTVRSFSLPPGIAHSFLAKLDAANAALSRNNLLAARGELQAFLNEVSAQRGKQLLESQADVLARVTQAAMRGL
jgi:pimeloyl-ACP methyl ester carboxylesterase